VVRWPVPLPVIVSRFAALPIYNRSGFGFKHEEFVRGHISSPLLFLYR